MKRQIQYVLLGCLMVAATPGQAAPRAAEDPSAVVISTNDVAPYVKRTAPTQPSLKQAGTKKKASAKKARTPPSKAARSAKPTRKAKQR